jgi:competence protein ComEA
MGSAPPDDAADHLLARLRQPPHHRTPGQPDSARIGSERAQPAPDELIPEPVPPGWAPETVHTADDTHPTAHELATAPTRGLSRWAVIALLGFALAGLLLWKFLPVTGRTLVTVATPSSAATVVTAPVLEQRSATPPTDPAPPQQTGASLVVDVSGAVKNPGVYTLTSGQRVADAITAAGGLTPDADATHLNRAQPIADAQKIHVPRRGEAPPQAAPQGSPAPAGDPNASSTGGDRINVNTATAEQLQSLPKIGPVLAERIIDHRTKNGPYRSLADLGKVKGCGPVVLKSIEDRVAFSS